MIPALVRSFLLLLIITFAPSYAWGEEPCSPKPETWPPASTPIPGLWWTPFTPRFHGSSFEHRCNLDASHLDTGALRCNNGTWEVLSVASEGAGHLCSSDGWCPYNPNSQGQEHWVNLYSRYGCGISGGHGHGRDDYVFPAEDYELATGEKLVFRSLEHIDTWYHPSLYKWIEFEARKKEGPPPLCPNRVCDPGEDATTCPQDCSGVEQKPVEPANPINSNCDNICGSSDRICDEDGKLIGGKCPSDCDPCIPIIKPPETPVNAISCRVFTDPLRETIRSLETELESLSRMPMLPEYLSVLYREEKTRAISGKLGICTRYNRNISQLCAVYLCPTDLVRVVCRRSI